MWKKNNKAVSPVIATILMVAITVVLAAVLYVMVMGFGGDGGGQAPTVSLTNSGNRLVMSMSTSYDNATGAPIYFTVNGAKCAFAGSTTAPTGYVVWPTGVFYIDAGDDGKISTQDYFVNSSGTPVTIQVVWSSGGTNQVLDEGTI